MSLFDDLVIINNSLSSTLQGINSLLPFEAETLKDTPPIIEVAIGSARQEGEEDGYEIGYGAGFGNASSIIVSRSNEVIEKYTTPAEDWSELPSKIEEVYGVGVHDGKISLLESSKYMRGAASGELVSLKDVSPVEHTVSVRSVSKNMYPYPYKGQTNFVRNNVTYAVNDDGTITANGISSATTYLWINGQSSSEYGYLIDIPSGTYSFSGCPAGGGSNTYRLQLNYYTDEGGTRKYIDDIGSGNTVTLSGNAPRYDFMIIIAGGTECNNLTFKPQIEVGTNVTPYTPYRNNFDDVNVQVLGKNWYNSTFTLGGLAGASGKEYANDTVVRTDFITVAQEQNYAISFPDGFVVSGRHAYDKDKNWLGQIGYTVSGMMQTMKTPANTAFVRLACGKVDETAFTETDIETLNALPIQLELGTIATEYEPYKFAEYTANEDGTVEGVKSVSPNMNIMSDTEGVAISCEYYRDIDLYVDSLITGVALSGGE